MHTSSRSRLSCALLLGLAACGGSNVASQLVQKPEYKPADETKCGVNKSQDHPLIVEWPSADRAALESQAKRGLVAVRYAGCTMEVLRRCRAKGTYSYTGLTKKHDVVTMKDSDELYANMPAYAAKFEAKLAKSGQLSVKMTIVGAYGTDKATVTKDDLEGSCEGATHVITGLTAGAFEFFAGGSAEVGAGVQGPAGIGAGAKSTAVRETLNQDGEEEACNKSSSKDKDPPDGCGALIRVEVSPITERDPNAPVPPPTASATPAAASAASAASAATGKGAPLGPNGCPVGMIALDGGGFSLNKKDVTVSALCIDATEVTAGAYEACVSEGKCSADGLGCGAMTTYGIEAKKTHPANCVDWAQANAYCIAVDKRLPYEEEWEWAARSGKRGLLYPWGNDAPSSQGCWGVAGHTQPCAVGTNTKGDTRDGVHDMSGNVWEWTLSSFDGKGRLRVIRGGSFQDAKPELLTATNRIPNLAIDRNVNLGFRCARAK